MMWNFIVMNKTKQIVSPKEYATVQQVMIHKTKPAFRINFPISRMRWG